MFYINPYDSSEKKILKKYVHFFRLRTLLCKDIKTGYIQKAGDVNE